MKKIHAKHDNKDRIVCVTVSGKHEFYYQRAGAKERLWLFNTNDFSGCVFAYFRNKGRNLNGRGFSLTMKELYEFKDYRNSRLVRIMERIPGQVEYVLLNGIETAERIDTIPCVNRSTDCFDSYDDERAA